MHDVLQVKCVAVEYHCFYAIYTKATVRYKTKSAIVSFQILVYWSFPADLLMFVLLWVFLAELCWEFIERRKALSLFYWKTLIFYYLGLHDRQKSLHEKTKYTHWRDKVIAIDKQLIPLLGL